MIEGGDALTSVRVGGTSLVAIARTQSGTGGSLGDGFPRGQTSAVKPSYPRATPKSVWLSAFPGQPGNPITLTLIPKPSPRLLRCRQQWLRVGIDEAAIQ